MILSAKDLFYSAMILNYEQLEGIDYIFPISEKALISELNETKLSLHKRKLLREKSHGEIILDTDFREITRCVAFPEKITPEEDTHDLVYESGCSLLRLKQIDGGYAAELSIRVSDING